jgi:signal transduction histidine kinase
VRIPERMHLRPARQSDALTAKPTGHNGTEEDAHILRRTRLRLMAWSGGITLVILLVMGVATYSAVSNLVSTDNVSRLRGFADLAGGAISGKQPVGQPQQVDPEFGTRYAGILIVGLDSTGQVFMRTRSLPPGVPVQAGINAVAAGGTDVREVITGRGVPLRVFTESVRDPDGDVYVVQTMADRTQEVNLLNLLLMVLVGGGAAALLVALLAGYMYAGRALVPIKASISRRQEALGRQREFTANASHELRTPLTVIRASVEDLKRNRSSRVEDVGEALDDIEAEVRTVTALVDDMLLLARTDSGVVQLERIPLDLADTAAEAVSPLASLGAERGVAVTLDPLPAPMSGDPLRLRQLVTILVDNAIRHSPSGSSVEVRIRPEPGAALLDVEDNGPGIKPEDLSHLWERFWQADNAPAGGTGLGLAIAKWIVDQHGGTIGANNRVEGGARFWVRLPAAVGSAAGHAATEGVRGPEPGTAPPALPAMPAPGDEMRWAAGDREQPLS